MSLSAKRDKVLDYGKRIQQRRSSKQMPNLSEKALRPVIRSAMITSAMGQQPAAEDTSATGAELPPASLDGPAQPPAPPLAASTAAAVAASASLVETDDGVAPAGGDDESAAAGVASEVSQPFKKSRFSSSEQVCMVEAVPCADERPASGSTVAASHSPACDPAAVAAAVGDPADDMQKKTNAGGDAESAVAAEPAAAAVDEDANEHAETEKQSKKHAETDGKSDGKRGRASGGACNWRSKVAKADEPAVTNGVEDKPKDNDEDDENKPKDDDENKPKDDEELKDVKDDGDEELKDDDDEDDDDEAKDEEQEDDDDDEDEDEDDDEHDDEELKDDDDEDGDADDDDDEAKDEEQEEEDEEDQEDEDDNEEEHEKKKAVTDTAEWSQMDLSGKLQQLKMDTVKMMLLDFKSPSHAKEYPKVIKKLFTKINLMAKEGIEDGRTFCVNSMVGLLSTTTLRQVLLDYGLCTPELKRLDEQDIESKRSEVAARVEQLWEN